jgi:cyclin L
MGALYLASKLEECPLRMRDLINVYDLLLSRTLHAVSASSHKPFKYSPMSYFSSTFYDLKDALVVAEMQILKRLGFNVHVLLPYGTLVNYLRVLGLTNREDACQRAWGYLNDGYGLCCLFHYPTDIPPQASDSSLCTLPGADNRHSCNPTHFATSIHPTSIRGSKLLVVSL